VTSASSEARPRRDAQRNREKLLAAAREMFDQFGVGAPLDQIAKRANVANATLYRHFPNREALIEATFADDVAALAQGLQALLEIHDPWQAFSSMLELLYAVHADSKGFGELMTMEFPNIRRQFAEENDQIVQTVIRNAQEAGELRADFMDKDLPPMLWANAGLVEGSAAGDPEAWKRYLGFVLDGVRASAAGPARRGPMTNEQLMTAMRVSGARATGARSDTG
jgi:AcrR family transcriptional regulator